MKKLSDLFLIIEKIKFFKQKSSLENVIFSYIEICVILHRNLSDLGRVLRKLNWPV